MYLTFYGFKKKPFHITPDPDFLYLSPSHKEALGAVIYGIEQRMGFVAITGEVGTGKTTIIRSYLAKIDLRQVSPVYIFNAHVSFYELLINIFREIGLQPDNENISSMVHQLHRFLIDEYKQSRNTVLIIDEAQNMPIDTLEQLRILSNLETANEKLLQIVLVGQPELNENLDQYELRQLKQRLAIKATIQKLSPAESLEYIKHRLQKVTFSERNIFSDAALKRIVRYAKGIPRNINIICENALIAGFGYQKKQITSKIISEIMSDRAGRGKKLKLSWVYVSLLWIVFLLICNVLVMLNYN